MTFQCIYFAWLPLCRLFSRWFLGSLSPRAPLNKPLAIVTKLCKATWASFHTCPAITLTCES